MLSVLKYWARSGIDGRKCRAYLKLDHDNIPQLKIANRLFGPLYVGASLPRSVMKSSAIWSSIGNLTGDNRIGSWGGHAMGCPKLDRLGGSFYTWGARQRFTWRWWLDYVDEVYAVLSDDWFGVDGPAPNGFDNAALSRDLAALRAA